LGRLACVDLPAFPLQLLVRAHLEWRGLPAAVVSRDAPQGELLQINRAARAAGILPGQRYAAALSLCPILRAGVVSAEDVDHGVEQAHGLLLRFSPSVEPLCGEPGVFLADAAGLDRVSRSLSDWATAVRRDLKEIGFAATVAVGFTRLGVYAAARSSLGEIVFDSAEQERDAIASTPLERLGLPPGVRDDLGKLGVATVGRLASLPPHGLLQRYGEAAHRLALMARDDPWHPLEPVAPREPILQKAELDFAETDSARLAFLAKRLLDPLLAELARRGQALAELEIGLALDHAGDLVERIRPAAPTLDPVQVIDLVRLRLEAIALASGVTEMVLVAGAVEATPQQLRLFRDHGRRDPEAADRAFARIRARFGHDSVVRARIAEGHLPEASFTWEPMPPFGEAARGNPSSGVRDAPREERTLVRRIHTRPVPMGTRPVRGPNGVHLEGLESSPVVRMIGPYEISGGWWRREIRREYHFAHTADGRILWIYFDRNRRRWFLQGEME
jgi:protein ImuB